MLHQRTRPMPDAEPFLHPSQVADILHVSPKSIARRAEAMVLFDGARIVPVSSWTCCQSRLENNGANGANTRIISSGRVGIDHLF